MQFTGFLINGASGGMTTEAELLYNTLNLYGGTEQYGYAPDGSVGIPHLLDNIPYFQEKDLSGDTNDAANTIINDFDMSKVNISSQFHVYRTILQSPTYHINVMNTVEEQLGSSNNNDIVVVDPLVLSILTTIELN